MFQNKKLKRNATYVIAEVAEVALLIALLIALCPPLVTDIYYGFRGVSHSWLKVIYLTKIPAGLYS